MNNEIKKLDDLINKLEIRDLLEDLQKCIDDGQYEQTLKIEHIKLLLDYITNLQEEINELKAQLEMYENGVYFSSENNKLQEKIDKAIECINYYAIENSDYEKIYNIEEETLLNILGGKDG